jgi:hypothetical protein
VNTQVLIAIGRHRANAGAMTVESGAAAGLTGTLKGLAGAASLAAGAYGALEVFNTFRDGRASYKDLRSGARGPLSGTLEQQVAQLNAQINKQMNQSALSAGAAWILGKSKGMLGGVDTRDLLKELINRRNLLLSRLNNESNSDHDLHVDLRMQQSKAAEAKAGKGGKSPEQQEVDNLNDLIRQLSRTATSSENVARKARENLRKALAAQAKQLKAEATAALEAARKVAAAKEAMLRKQLKAMQDVARALAVANKLAGVDRDVSIVNGSALNMGSSFAQFGARSRNAAGGPISITVNVAGSVASERDLAGAILPHLQRYTRNNGSNGL